MSRRPEGPGAAAWAAGAVRARFTGALPESFLNECARRGLRFRGAEPGEPCELTLWLRAGDWRRAENAARGCGGVLTALERRGAPEVWRLARRRLVFCAALLAVLLGLFVSSLFIWDIEVAENPTAVPDSRILAVLAEQGVGIGSFWPAFTSDMIRSRALVELPELSWLTVNVRGSRAEVLVREAVPVPELRDEKTATDVTAARGGLIVELRVLEGQSAAAVGDTVAAGDVLVSGWKTSALSDGRLVHARAEVTARTWYEKTAFAPLETAVREPAGPTRTRFALILGKKRVNFSLGSGIPQGSCDKITFTYPLALEGVFALPVALVRETRQPMETRAVPRDADALAARLEAELRAWLDAQLGGDGTVSALSFARSGDAETLRVTLRAECRERIDRETPRKTD